MLLYYRFFHPAGPITLCSKQLQHNMECGNSPCLPDLNTEQTATLRSLKHCWQTDKNGCLTRLDGTSPQEGSPHSDDVCTDKKLLLTHWVSGQTAIPITRTVEHPAEEYEDKSVSCENISRDKRRGICSVLELGLGEEVEDGTGDGESMKKHKRRGICSLEPEMEVELAAHFEGRQKRRGICSPDLMGSELSNKDGEDTDNKEHGICSAVELTEQATHSEKSVKHPDDETPSDVLSVPSEVLSAHDYENMCAVNIAREAWGLRSWRGYSDIETWLHDDSVVHDRRRDTLTSTTTTLTSASSDHSGVNDYSSSVLPPPVPCRRPAPGPRALRSRQDDYLDTLIDDLADCETNVCCQDRPLAEFFAEEHDPSMFVARPYVVDQHGALFPLTTLDTIVEELEESSTSTESSETIRHKQCHDSASTLVATINEIRHGDSICSLYSSTDVLWDVQQPSFCDSVPDSLLKTSHSRAHLSPEEVLFLSKLQPMPDAELELSPSSEDNISTKPSPEVILDASPYLESVQNMDSHCPTNDIMPKTDDSVPRKKQAANRPRRKFSLLREKFEAKQTEANIEVDPKPPETPQFCVDCPAVSHDDSRLSVPCESEREPIVCFNKENVTPVVPKRIKQWNNYLKAQNSCNSRCNPEPCKVICSPTSCDSDL
ncbi:hypothetical protein Cfor_08570, partial [Coptotermes formosanus]